MNETSPLERKTRLLADAYMEQYPGVTRQKAKRRVRTYAAMQLAFEQMRKSMQRAAAAFRKFAKEWNKAVGR